MESEHTKSDLEMNSFRNDDEKIRVQSSEQSTTGGRNTGTQHLHKEYSVRTLRFHFRPTNDEETWLTGSITVDVTASCLSCKASLYMCARVVGLSILERVEGTVPTVQSPLSMDLEFPRWRKTNVHAHETDQRRFRKLPPCNEIPKHEHLSTQKRLPCVLPLCTFRARGIKTNFAH